MMSQRRSGVGGGERGVCAGSCGARSNGWCRTGRAWWSSDEDGAGDGARGRDGGPLGPASGCGRQVRPRRGEPDLGDHLEVDALRDVSVAFHCDAGAAAARPCRSCDVAGGGRACRSRLLGAGSFERRREPAPGGARVCRRFMFAVGERLFALAAGQPAGRPSRVGAGVLSTTCTRRSPPPLLSAPTHAIRLTG